MGIIETGRAARPGPGRPTIARPGRATHVGTMSRPMALPREAAMARGAHP